MEEEKYERSAPQRRKFPTRENFRNIFPCFIFVSKARQLEIRKGEVKKLAQKGRRTERSREKRARKKLENMGIALFCFTGKHLYLRK